MWFVIEVSCIDNAASIIGKGRTRDAAIRDAIRTHNAALPDYKIDGFASLVQWSEACGRRAIILAE